jgi:hypothetical protein
MVAFEEQRSDFKFLAPVPGARYWTSITYYFDQSLIAHARIQES